MSVEVRVGLLILVALGLLGGFIFVLGGVELGDQYSVYVDFDNPGNVQPGASVNIGSIRVGEVEGIEYWGQKLDPETGRRPMIRMHVRIDTEVQETIHEDALFYVTSQSVLGESIISIDPGDPEKPHLEDGAVVEGVDPPRLDLAFAMAYELLEGMTRLLRENREDLGDLLSSAANMIRRADAFFAEHDDRLDRVMENIETATTQTNELLTTANDTMNGRVQRVLRNLDTTLARVSQDIDPIMSEVRSLTTKADDAMDTLGPEQRQQIQEILAEAEQSVNDARAIVAHIRSGRGTVGAFLMDEEVYDDVQEMLRDLKHNPWKLFWRE